MSCYFLVCCICCRVKWKPQVKKKLRQKRKQTSVVKLICYSQMWAESHPIAALLHTRGIQDAGYLRSKTMWQWVLVCFVFYNKQQGVTLDFQTIMVKKLGVVLT